ncbi:MAG: DNA-directed RNA polymerase subunit omega [Alphaproteobacteria bacterium]
MARVTVEDCIEKVPNRFDLIVASAQRAREIGSGHPIMVERDKDKNPVVALREIAEGHVTAEGMKEKKVLSLLRGNEEHDEEPQLQDDETQLIERHRALESLGSDMRESFSAELGGNTADESVSSSFWRSAAIEDNAALGEMPLPNAQESLTKSTTAGVATSPHSVEATPPPTLYEDIQEEKGEPQSESADSDDESAEPEESDESKESDDKAEPEASREADS